MNLYLTTIDMNMTEDILQNRMSLLCANRLKKVLACKRKEDRIRSVSAGLLMQKGLATYRKSCCAEELPRDENGILLIEIAETQRGKPYFAEYPWIKFSIAHSGKMVGCVFGEAEVGLDIQEKRPCNHEKLIRRFHEKEQKKYYSLSGEDAETYFFRLWTAKEAYVKYTGNGLFEDFSSFYVDLDEGTVCKNGSDITTRVQEIQVVEEGYYCMLAFEIEQKLHTFIEKI